MTVKIHITNLASKEVANALRAISTFIDGWKHLSKVEIILEVCDC